MSFLQPALLWALPLITLPVLIHLMQPYVSGLNRHGDMQIYVSRGTGYWGPPNRAGSPSEITLLTLRRAARRAVVVGSVEAGSVEGSGRR